MTMGLALRSFGMHLWWSYKEANQQSKQTTANGALWSGVAQSCPTLRGLMDRSLCLEFSTSLFLTNNGNSPQQTFLVRMPCLHAVIQGSSSFSLQEFVVLHIWPAGGKECVEGSPLLESLNQELPSIHIPKCKSWGVGRRMEKWCLSRQPLPGNNGTQ